MTPLEFLYETYLMLMENDYKFSDVDEMDMLGYFDVIIFRLEKEEEEARDRLLSIL